MATYTTTQAGNWNNAATWGGSGYPTNGDTATIVHTVTYNINDDVNTIATINLNTNGILQWTGGAGTLALRFTNMSISGGKLIGKDGTFIRCLGYLQVQNTASSEISMIGSVPNSQTTLSSSSSIGDGYISVVSSSGFGVGDYISVYDYDNISYDNQTNECFIINYISGNTIYLRRWVGPNFTLIQDTNSGSNAFYTESDVRSWKSGMKFLVDTETFQVSSIDIYNKIIYTTSNSIGSYLSGSTAYETGCESNLTSGYTVYKLCSSIISAVSGDNYIDVASAGGWLVDDELALGGSTYSYSEKVTISGITVGGGSDGSDRIYLTSNLVRSHDLGGTVVKLNRDCVFHGNTTDTTDTTSGYIYVIAGTTDRTFRFENFEMKYYGNSSSVYYSGICLRSGYSGKNSILLNVVGRYTATSSYLGIFCTYSYYYNVFLNNVLYNTTYGIGLYGGGSYSYFSGNICLKQATVGLYNYGSLGSNNMGNVSFDYSIVESNNAYGLYSYYPGPALFSTTYNDRQASRERYLRFNYNTTCIYTYVNNAWKFDLSKINVNNLQTRLIYRDQFSIGCCVLKDVNIESGYIMTTTNESPGANGATSLNVFNQISILENYQFIQGNKMIRFMYGYAVMDETIRKSKYSWKVTPKNNASTSFMGMFAIISGLQGKTIKAGGYLRKDGTTNSTVKIDLIDEFNNILDSQTLTTTNTWEWKTVSYTFSEDKIILVRIGGYGSTGNFWFDKPTIYTDGCLTQLDLLNNFWIQGDPNATGIRLKNGMKII